MAIVAAVAVAMVVIVIYCSEYIILLWCLYYFIVLKAKIDPLIDAECFVKWVGKIDKVTFL